MAKRYKQEEKDEILAFVEQHNKEHGRGGQTAAAKKFKINAITLKSWMDKAGIASPGRSRAKKATKKRGRAAKVASTPAVAAEASAPRGRKSAGSVGSKLERMISIQSKIEQLQKEFDELKAGL